MTVKEMGKNIASLARALTLIVQSRQGHEVNDEMND